MNLNLGLVNLDGDDMLVAGYGRTFIWRASFQGEGSEVVVARRRACHQTCF